MPTRANATKKYKDSLIAEVNEAINQGINTTSPISVGVSKYNPAVVNEVISLLTKSGWDVTGINIDGIGSYSTIIVS
ncbi:Phage protein [Lacticaseibacillus paracasei subsp. paracasei]|uniref:Phage protein n=1 Tax=Lacticaseibacillus paracasei subsp. paracasei TaxID=47714 RepID=A0AAP9HGR8_LACPA|nr:Phage protein [Lacticaseibacillus paracasei subsp. paracasei]